MSDPAQPASDPRPVAVLGGGASGRAVAGLLERLGRPFRVFDEAGGERGASEFEPQPGQFAEVVVSPGFPPAHPWRLGARVAGVSLAGESAFAARHWKGSLLCVTGTNGKTTLVRLLEQALRANGEDARACGNIGTPLSALCLSEGGPDAVAVCEASSFQLFDWDPVSCAAGFWTNFDRDHLDWHPDEKAYFLAKWRLLETGAPVFAGPSVAIRAKAFGLRLPPHAHLAGPDERRRPAPGVFGGAPWSELYALAAAWWDRTGRPPGVLAGAARDFALLPHRMEEVGTAGGVRFVNDSKATNPHAALAALRASTRPVHWLAGGSRKGEDSGALAAAAAPLVDSADAFGETGAELAASLGREGCPAAAHPGLEAAFRSAVSRARPGSTVLLSPAFASFDQFSGYADRGDAFRRLVARRVAEG